MVDCSKTEEFLKEWKRMCDSSHCTCSQCCLYKMADIGSCHTAMRTMPKQVIMEVQKWSDEHPRKTRQSEFLKMFPNAKCWHNERGDVYIEFCPKLFDTTSICIKDGSGGCRVCIEKYWSEEVE